MEQQSGRRLYWLVSPALPLLLKSPEDLFLKCLEEFTGEPILSFLHGMLRKLCPEMVQECLGFVIFLSSVLHI